eukprot:707785-Amphidinium_carterae.1
MKQICVVARLLSKHSPSKGVALLRLLFNGMAYPNIHNHPGLCCWCHDTHTGHPTYAPLFRGCYRNRLSQVAQF